MIKFHTLDELKNTDIKNKRVLLRVDLNVPMKGNEVADTTRLKAAGPTIKEIADAGGKVILLSHFGRPKGRDPSQSLRPIAAALSRVIGRPIAFAEDCIGEVAEKAVAAMKPGGILCLENTRFHAEEEKNDPGFARKLARLGEIFVDDAFSVAHRAHASNTGIVTQSAHVGSVGAPMPAFAGRTMQAELEVLGNLFEKPQRPLAAIVGGAKISTKLDLLGNLIDTVDILIIGGGMANTFLAAQGNAMGISLCETNLLPTAREIMEKAKQKRREIVLPVDAVVAQKFEANAPSRVVDVDHIGAADMMLDIGPKSIGHVISVLARTKTLVWNGPFGAFEIEAFDNGTVEVAEAAAELTQAGKLVTVAGGGDTVAALHEAGVAERFTYVSTAGGAFLEWLEGKPLPGVEVLRIQ
jgi:phosphoglycerate kinase